MTQFHEGQEIEIHLARYDGHTGLAMPGYGKQAKIVKPLPGTPVLDPGYYVAQFRDGSRTVCNAEYIRLPKPIF